VKQVYSFYPSRREANKFAEKLIGMEAEGVAVGTFRTAEGWPVFSEASDEIVDRVGAEHEAELVKKSAQAMEEYGEKYEYETATKSMSSVQAVYELTGSKKIFTPNELIRLARDELRKYGIKNVSIVITKYQGMDPAAPYANASVGRHSSGKWRLRLHPVNLYMDEEYIRDTVKHEAEHILGKR